MIKRISQILVLLTVLFAMAGNTVRLGACPCHPGIFLGDCACNEGTCNGHSCGACEACAEPACCTDGEDEDCPDHCSGHCDNNTVEVKDPFTGSSQAKAPPAPSLTEIPVQAVCWIDSSSMAIRQLFFTCNKFRPPPGPPTDLRQSFTGCMRPLLA